MTLSPAASRSLQFQYRKCRRYFRLVAALRLILGAADLLKSSCRQRLKT